jgi:hypothetical protein
MIRIVALLALLLAAAACKGESSEQAPSASIVTRESPATVATPAKPASATPPHFPRAHTLLLSQAQFVWETGDDGQKKPKPGPAKLLMLTLVDGQFVPSILEDPQSRVFHKAMCVESGGQARLMTIGGTDALLKLWRVDNGGWQADTLWHPSFGGKWDRLRDVEIGNLQGDQHKELVLATHDQGVVAVGSQVEGSWVFSEVDRAAGTFVHEIEIGDVDGDGMTEIYATPSKPNKADRSQAGSIRAYRTKRKGFAKRTVAQFSDTHAKEILVADLDGNHRPELYAAVEAAHGFGGADRPVEIHQYLAGKRGSWKPRVIASLPGAVQSRVLLAADLTGSGKQDIVTTTMKAGIWRLIRPKRGKGTWIKEQIDASSGGYEHAAGIADLDSDGRPELYVAADEQDAVRQYVWEGTHFVKKTIHQLDKSDLTWNITSCKPITLD